MCALRVRLGTNVNVLVTLEEPTAKMMIVIDATFVPYVCKENANVVLVIVEMVTSARKLKNLQNVAAVVRMRHVK